MSQADALISPHFPLVGVEISALAAGTGTSFLRGMESLMAITRYSVDDYEEMIRLGALTENDRVELIRGEIVPKKRIGPRHASCLACDSIELLVPRRR